MSVEVEEKKAPATGKLFVISTPIGNSEDISKRAVRLLSLSDIVVCEEYKVGARLMHTLGIKKEMDQLNEQNEAIKAPELIKKLLSGKKIAIISDCGTPVFADPGLELLRSAIYHKLDIEVAPGASSIMTALVRSGFSLKQFLYAGFLDRLPEIRRKQIKNLSFEPRTVVLLETPYRLMPVLEALKEEMPNRKAYIGMNLTMHYETHHYGTFAEIFDRFKEQRIKAEFVICFQGSSFKPERSSEQYAKRSEKPYGKKPYGKKTYGNTSQGGRTYRDKPYRKKSETKPRDNGQRNSGSNR